MTIRRLFLVGKVALLPFALLYALMWAQHNQGLNDNLYPEPIDKGAYVQAQHWTPDMGVRFHNCRDAAKVKRFATELVVVTLHGERTYREQFDTAWAINHDSDSTNDLWVVGKCF